MKIPGVFLVREQNKMGGAWTQEESVMVLMPKVFVSRITFLGMKGMLSFVLTALWFSTCADINI